jgi:hypothetical protein
LRYVSGIELPLILFFFSNHPLNPDELSAVIPYLKGAERVKLAPNTPTCRVERGGPVPC